MIFFYRHITTQIQLQLLHCDVFYEKRRFCIASVKGSYNWSHVWKPNDKSLECVKGPECKWQIRKDNPYVYESSHNAFVKKEYIYSWD